MREYKQVCEQQSSIDYVKLGKRIQKIRKMKNLTQNNLAELCKCSVNHLSAVENGINKPSLELIINISVELNVTIDELVTGCAFLCNSYVKNKVLAEKLNQCDEYTLNYIVELIDSALDLRENIIKDIEKKYTV